MVGVMQSQTVAHSLALRRPLAWEPRRWCCFLSPRLGVYALVLSWIVGPRAWLFCYTLAELLVEESGWNRGEMVGPGVRLAWFIWFYAML